MIDFLNLSWQLGKKVSELHEMHVQVFFYNVHPHLRRYLIAYPLLRGTNSA